MTFDEKREMVWADYSSGLISQVRADEMLREIGYAEEKHRRECKAAEVTMTIFSVLDRTWMSLRDIAEARGRELSGSYWETVADRLVEQGHAESKPMFGVPMGKVYRRVL